MSQQHGNLVVVTSSLPGLGTPEVPQVFTPAAAAEKLRARGLTTITECALRARAYRKQVPFHLNGRRIVFTLADLAEIAQGQACAAQPRQPAPHPTVPPRPSRGHARSCPQPAAETWRARRSPHPSQTAPEDR